MRTLFLLTILAALLVIVIKKPDQTFWEAAHGLWGKIEWIASEVGEAPPVPRLTGTSREDFAALQKRIRRALGTYEKRSGDAVDGEFLATGSKGGTDRNRPPTIGNAKIPASSSGSSGDFVLSVPQVTDLPYIPAVPVAPVEVVEIGKSVTPPSRSRPRPADSRNLGEVKAYYENASRLLAEIQ